MNKILVPLNNVGRLNEFVEAGADEFYMGFYDDGWTESFGEYSEINRMSGFGRSANPYSLQQLLEIAKKIKGLGKSIFITINNATYTQRELDKLREYFQEFARADIDGVIVSTPEVTVMAKETGLIPVASTMCGIFNADIVQFYQDLGMDRMILPRDLTLKEIEDIVKAHPEVHYEVFLMRNGCQFADSHCLGFHRQKGSICGMLNTVHCNINSQQCDFHAQHDIELNNMLYTKAFHKAAACGLCALYRFYKMGIGSYKIVGRSESGDGILQDIRLIKQNLAIIEECASEEEYLQKMAMPNNARLACKMGLSCYYPEVRF